MTQKVEEQTIQLKNTRKYSDSRAKARNKTIHLNSYFRDVDGGRH